MTSAPLYARLLLSCLREACKNGHDAAAGLLIRRGALQDDLRSTEGTPLHDAARGGSAPTSATSAPSARSRATTAARWCGSR